MQIILQFDFIIQSQRALSSTSFYFFAFPFCHFALTSKQNSKLGARKNCSRVKNLRQGVVLLWQQVCFGKAEKQAESGESTVCAKKLIVVWWVYFTIISVSYFSFSSLCSSALSPYLHFHLKCTAVGKIC